MTGLDVLALGGLTLDWVRDGGGVHGPTPGGNALYAAVGAWLTGATVGIVAVVGADYPEAMIGRLERGGIRTELVRRVAGPSFRVLLDGSGPRRVIRYLEGSGRNDELDPIPAQLSPLASERVAGAHVAAIPTSSQRALVSALGGRAEVVTLDTVVIPGQIEPSVTELLEVASPCTVFAPSREEAEYLWPQLEPLRDICGMGSWAAPHNVIKLGAQGSVGCSGGRTHLVPAAAADVADTTGAGDSYCGALCAALARGDDLPLAMAWASAAASLVIEEFGCMELLDEDARRRTRVRAEQVLRSTMTSRRTA